MCMQTHRVRARMDSGLNFLEGHVPPIDGLTQRVADFLFEYLLLNKHRLNLVEIEAKLGWVWDNELQERLKNYLADSECALRHHDGYRFWSHVSKEFLDSASEHLNSNYAILLEREQPDVWISSASEEDEILELPGVGRVRRTTDLKTQEVSYMCKTPLDHLNMLAPHLPYDYRFTVSIEEPVSAPTPEGYAAAEKLYTRIKLRRTFVRGLWKVEITSVDATDHIEKTREDKFEVEVECVDVPKLAKLSHADFLQQVQILLNTVRTLAVLQLRHVRDASSSSSASLSGEPDPKRPKL